VEWLTRRLGDLGRDWIWLFLGQTGNMSVVLSGQHGVPEPQVKMEVEDAGPQEVEAAGPVEPAQQVRETVARDARPHVGLQNKEEHATPAAVRPLPGPLVAPAAKANPKELLNGAVAVKVEGLGRASPEASKATSGAAPPASGQTKGSVPLPAGQQSKSEEAPKHPTRAEVNTIKTQVNNLDEVVQAQQARLAKLNELCERIKGSPNLRYRFS